MELIWSDRTDGYGCVIVLPGGGYRILAEHETQPPMDWLTAQGWRCAALKYTVDPSPYPLALLEVLTAIAQVRQGVYGPVTGPVGVLGFSAGGHLAGLSATATPTELAQVGLDGPPAGRPDFSMYAYPVVSLSDYTDLGTRDSLLWELEDPRLVQDLSIENRVDPGTGPMFIWTTAGDEVVPPQSSMVLADACVGSGVPVELHLYPGGRHGMGMTGSRQVDAAWAAAGAWLTELRQGQWLTETGD
ncbi:MAG: alpha/beta hydrolase [Propionibacteriaceae bacterium]|jgi:acetyl esterase/lipase|nr:alpha/beta hydrolase [Propionibacteriaceae bacterium]